MHNDQVTAKRVHFRYRTNEGNRERANMIEVSERERERERERDRETERQIERGGKSISMGRRRAEMGDGGWGKQITQSVPSKNLKANGTCHLRSVLMDDT